jgi:protein arginine N-methyltransferase 5
MLFRSANSFGAVIGATDFEITGKAVSLKRSILDDVHICIRKGTQIVIEDNFPHFPECIVILNGLHADNRELGFLEKWELRRPMAPLTEMLANQNYLAFESDPHKYNTYEKAIRAALQELNLSDPIVAVAGAGRGPLVDRAIVAGARKIYAIERNPLAVEFLRLRFELEWSQNWDIAVQIICGDMRTVQLDSKIDLLITELLGSFGDNELSPECVQGCDRLLSEKGGSIPASYESFVVPISSQYLWAIASSQGDLNTISDCSIEPSYFLSEPGRCFKFEHPGQNRLYDTKHLEFAVTKPGVFHGLGGWFECKLYRDVWLKAGLVNGTRVRERRVWSQLFSPSLIRFQSKKGKELRSRSAASRDQAPSGMNGLCNHHGHCLFRTAEAQDSASHCGKQEEST